jgi:hypothetical protein
VRQRGFCPLLGAVLTLSLGAPAFAAGPSVLSVEDNVAYAVGAICAPYALDNMEIKDLPIGKGLVQPDHHDGLGRPSPTGVRVGMAGFVHVTFSGGSDGSRSCDVQARDADPQRLRKAALDALAQRPEQFAPTKSKYLPGRSFETEDLLCARADGSHPAGLVMLSSPGAVDQRKIALMFTLTNGSSRAASCDHEGVRLNFRALAP